MAWARRSLNIWVMLPSPTLSGLPSTRRYMPPALSAGGNISWLMRAIAPVPSRLEPITKLIEMGLVNSGVPWLATAGSALARSMPANHARPSFWASQAGCACPPFRDGAASFPTRARRGPAGANGHGRMVSGHHLPAPGQAQASRDRVDWHT